jgi:general secretion pathway protein K
MRIRLQQVPRGIALIVVMIAIFVLSVLAGAFAFSMKVETKLAMNANNQTTELWLGRSGVERARWIIALGMSCPYSSLNQKWAGGQGDDCETNGPLADVSVDNFQICDRTISIKITDLERKADINTADQTMLQQGLTMVGVDASEIPSITSCILDWIDADDIPRVGGAESEYYQALTPPYSAKNAPIDDLSELLLVRGITEDMYWGSSSTNHVSAAFQQVDRFGRPVERPVYPVGLEDLFTSLSSGKINVNTASAEVLQLIPGIDENMAQSIVGQREQAPYHSLNEMPVPPQIMQQLQRFGTVRSSTWKVEVTVEGANRKFYAIVRSNSPRDIPILVFYWEDS